MGHILVTGGAGFIGSSLCAELVRLGERVRILDDFSSGRRENLLDLDGKVEVVEGSITDRDALTRSMRGVSLVFHQAAIPSVARSVENPEATMRAGVMGTTLVLETARDAKVRRVIFAASSSAYGNTKALPKVETMTPEPLSPYAVSKLAGEHLLRVFSSLYNMETLSLRYFNVFGPRQDPKSEYAAVIPRFVTCALKKERPTIYGDGGQTRDFCYIDNTVGANLLAANAKGRLSGEVINVACAERISLNDLVRYIGEEAEAVGLFERASDFTAHHEAERPGDVRDSLADISLAEKLIGYVPKVLVREGIRRTFAAFRAKG